jgi:hypothetical protein
MNRLRPLLPIVLAAVLLACPPSRDAAHEGEGPAAASGDTEATSSPAGRLATTPTAEAGERYAAARAKLEAASYREAADGFRALTQAHPEFGPAWYGLAQAFTQARAQEKCSVDGADPMGIQRALRRALVNDGATAQQAAQDPLLAPLRTMLFFQVGVIGRNITDREDVARALARSEGLVVQGSAEGMWGPMAGAEFEEGGRVVLWRIDPSAEHPRVEARGRFSVDADATVHVELDEAPAWGEGGRSFSGKLALPGHLDLEGFGTLGDNDAECDA